MRKKDYGERATKEWLAWMKLEEVRSLVLW
jgi:hypothetical protein